MVSYDAAGTFAGRTITQPAAGITVSNGDGVSGNPTLALANDLSALEGLGTTGVASRTASDTWATSSITQDAVILGAASEGLANLALTNGQLVIGSTGTTPVAAVLTDPAAGLTTSVGAGSITFALADDLAGLEAITGTGVVSRTAADTYATSSITQYAVHVGNATEGLTALALGTSTQVLTSNGAGANPSWQAAPGGLSWVVETTTSRAAAVNEGIITNNAGLVTITIPDTAAVGDILKITNIGAGLFAIAQNASEYIQFGNVTTTVGVGGSITAIDAGDSIELVCTLANTGWNVLSSVGNFTIV